MVTLFGVYVSDGEKKKSDVELHRKYALLRLKWLSGDLYGKHYDIMCVKMALRESKSMTQ